MQGAYYLIEDSFNSDLTAEELKDNSVAQIDSYAASGDIDATSNIANNAIYVFSGSSDTVVPTKNQETVQLIYHNYSAGTETLVIEDVEHEIVDGKPVEIVKWLHEQLGYQNAADFAADGDPESNGSYITFD